MGCDIHGRVERKVGNKWVAERELTELGALRNYERFAKLAGVRGDGPEARGMPIDISDTARLHLESWGVDVHSCSYLPLGEAAGVFLATTFGLTDWQRQYSTDTFFGVSIDGSDSRHERRLVFWFDN